MTKITKCPVKKITIFSFLALGFCFIAGESLAQSDKDKMEMENAKPTDRPVIDHTSDLKDYVFKGGSAQPVVNINRENPQPIKKEGNISGEGKKVETVPSTLSFNIFLYIVDKFKAD
jgi:hypothetical protein